jgi:aspartyl-tRNA(Asn)/glutamyl-tRNA(Gln) amidotransferase subunit C
VLLPHWKYATISHMISTQEVKNLADLAHLKLSSEEIEKFKTDISSILNYVDSINSVDIQREALEDDHINVLRDDVVINEPDQFSETLLEAAPEREGRYVKVPKILSQDE